MSKDIDNIKRLAGIKQYEVARISQPSTVAEMYQRNTLIEKFGEYEPITQVVLKNGKLVEERFEDFSQKGGVIVFSPVINATGEKGLLGRLKSYFKTKSQLLNKEKMVDKAAKDALGDNFFGYTFGKAFQGRYVSNAGVMFTEKSFTVEVIGISSEQLEVFATQICREFDQEAVLVKDYMSGDIYLVNSK